LSQSSATPQIAPPRLHFRVPPRPSHLLRARDRIRDYLRQYCTDALVIDDVVLCIEEAATNAIRHSGVEQPIELSLYFEGGELVAAVRDRGCGFDVATFDPEALPDLLTDHGRGLFIIARLMDGLELRVNGGLEVLMRRRAEARCDPLSLQSGLGEPRAAGAAGRREARTRALLEDIDEAFFALDWEYRYVYANQQASRITHKSLDEMLGHTPWELFPAIADMPLGRAYHDAMELGRPTVVEHRSVVTDDWLEVRIYPTDAGVSAYYREINRRKLVELEREQLIADLSRSSARARFLADVVEQADMAFAIRLPDGRLVTFNQAFADLTGYSRQELEEGSSTWAAGLTPPDWWRAEAPLLAEAVATRRPVRYEKEYLRKDGTRVPIEVFAQPVFDDDGALLHYRSFITDISQRKRAEEALRDSREQLRAALASMTDAVVISDADGRFIDFNDAFATFHRFADKEECAATIEEYSDFLEVSLPDGTVAPLDQWAVSRALRGEVMTDAEYNLRRKDTGETWVGSYSFGPIRDSAGAIVGSVVVGRDITERKRAEHQLQSLLEQTQAQAHELQAAQELARQELETTVVLSDAIGSLTQSLAVDEVLDRLARIVLRASGHARVTVGLWDEGGERLEIATSRGRSALRRGLAWPLDGLSVPVRRAVLERVTTIVDHDGLEPAERGTSDGEEWHLLLAVPLVFADRLVGLLVIDDPGERREFAERDIGLVEGIVAQATAAIENARLHEEVAVRERFSAALNEIDVVIHSTLKVDEIMQRVVAYAVGVVGADSAMVALRRGDDWVAEYGHPEVPGVIHESVRSDEAPFMIEAITKRLPVAIDDCDTDPRCIPAVQRRFGVRSVLCLPLIARDEALGVIFFNHHRAAVKFTPQTVDFAGRLAGAISAALENARMYEEQQRIAVILQENLIREPPVVDGLELGVAAMTAYEPELVGGDFSDVFAIDGSHVVVLIADVAGKGVRAAGLTETVRSAVHAFATIEPSPAFILARSNELLRRFDPDEPHVTAFVAVLDPATGELRYASAGHPPPIHLSALACRPLEVAFGPPLGSFTHDYVNAQTMLTLEDYLVLYTDGVTEARRGRELLGEARLVEVVAELRGGSAQQVADGVRDAALGFGGRLRDDLQVVVLRLA
jgi:PAS domain S-box-containing protein